MNDERWYEFSLEEQGGKTTYYALSVLGEGGFGQVWSGITDTGLPVAIKIIKKSSDKIQDFLNWFGENFILLQCLDHPHIVESYDHFESKDGWLVIVMEMAEGSLQDYIEISGPVNPIEVCSIGIQLCNALDHIHKLGVIHRDITPRNILWFNNGRFKLSDFGISKQTAPDEIAKTFIGLRSAIPPELIKKGYSSNQSDIYQLGLVLLTMLTGTAPIPLDAPSHKIRDMILNGIPRKTAESLTPTFQNLAVILSVMLRRRDEWRYENIGEVRQELREELRLRQRRPQRIPLRQKGPLSQSDLEKS